MPESVRQKICLYTSLPTALTVHWLQQHRLGDLLARRAQIQTDLNTESTSSDPGSGRKIQQLSQELSNVEDRICRNSWWLGCPKSSLAKLRKSEDRPAEFLQMSDSLLRKIAPSSSLLEIQFEGESGFGSAVTRSFFSAIGREFVRSSERCLWIHEGGDFISAGKRGLRLLPVRDPGSQIAADCKLLGRLIGRAIAEGYLVPLPLSVATWAMIRDPSEARPIEALPMPGDGTSGEFVGACALLVSEHRESGLPMKETWGKLWNKPVAPLTEFGAVFLETGFSGADLLDGQTRSGEETHVTEANVGEFVALATRHYLHDGIDMQLSAIRSGIGEVLPVEALLLFTPLELKTVVCGEDEIVWDEPLLRDILNFHEMNGQLDGDMQRWLVETLLEMSNQQRSTFLDFVTSCPRLPPGGSLRIEVFPETIATSNLTSPVLRPAMPPLVGGLGSPPSPIQSLSGVSTPSLSLEVTGYPRSRACVNHLYLPRYRSRQTLKERLVEAMVSSVHHDEITG